MNDQPGPHDTERSSRFPIRPLSPRRVDLTRLTEWVSERDWRQSGYHYRPR